jgi:response regulator RpfG family c-di-GMP phosphodiesterase
LGLVCRKDVDQITSSAQIFCFKWGIAAMGKKFHILVADDESSVRGILRDLILALGEEYIVYTAADSFEALHMLHSVPLELALIDIFMPGLNGFELLKEARAKYPNVMMVVITGQPSYKMVLEALRLGATDFLSKPISLAELRKILTKLKEAKTQKANGSIQSNQETVANLEVLTQKMHDKIQGQYFLHSLSEKLAAIRSAKELYPFLTDMALTLTGGTQAAFFLYNQELGRFRRVSQSGENSSLAMPQPVIQQNAPNDYGISIEEIGLETKKLPSRNCLSLPLKLRGELLGVLHIYGQPGKHFEDETVRRLQLLVDRSTLTLENLTLHESAFSNLYDTLTALINSLEARDPYSRHHSVRVTHIAGNFSKKLHLADELVDSLRLAGALHDIGKIGIPDAILLKPDKLSPEEIDIIRQHPVIGDNIVAPLNLLPRERALILHHHERWDGSGYPMGLAGEEIPILSRIIALADSYDAITSDRPYRKCRTHDEALVEITAHAGSQFDPDLTRQFVEIMSQPAAAKEICGVSAELEKGESLLSDQQFLQLKNSLSHKLVHLNGFKKVSAAFPHSTAAQSDI